jgi:hypothetical protein
LSGKLKYPAPSYDPHYRGQVIGGACWDLKGKGGMTTSYVNQLVYESVTGMQTEEQFGDFMDQLLEADEYNSGDQDIYNGTPNQNLVFNKTRKMVLTK